MRLVLQRVTGAGVSIDGFELQTIGAGLVVLVGISGGDNEAISAFMAEKTANLRIFDDGDGNMNLSLLDVGGACLVVSNFTLYARCRKGRRPSFIDAAPPVQSEPLYRHFIRALAAAGVGEIRTGAFGADMRVEISNDGPVTIILESDEIMPQ